MLTLTEEINGSFMKQCNKEGDGGCLLCLFLGMDGSKLQSSPAKATDISKTNSGHTQLVGICSTALRFLEVRYDSVN